MLSCGSVQNSAEQAVRDMLKEISTKFNLKPIDTLHAVDYMDDGTLTPINHHHNHHHHANNTQDHQSNWH